MGKCTDLVAEAIPALQKAGIRGEKIAIQRTGQIKLLASKSWKNGAEAISTNGYHEALKIGETVFDNIHKNGIKYSEWLDDLFVNVTSDIDILKPIEF